VYDLLSLIKKESIFDTHKKITESKEIFTFETGFLKDTLFLKTTIEKGGKSMKECFLKNKMKSSYKYYWKVIYLNLIEADYLVF